MMTRSRMTKEEFSVLTVEVFIYVDEYDGKKYKGAACTYPERVGGCSFIDGYPVNTRDDIMRRHLLDNILYYDVE